MKPSRRQVLPVGYQTRPTRSVPLDKIPAPPKPSTEYCHPMRHMLLVVPKATGAHWMSAKDAANYLGITLRTLYKLIDTGELPAYKMGRVIRLRPADLEAFVQGSRIQPGELKHLYPPLSVGVSDPDDGDR